MALSECIVEVDDLGRELLQHGTADFPIACYHDDLRAACVPWHWHEELEAAVITQGSCVVTAGTEKYVLRAGDGFFVNTGILHGCWDTDQTGCRFHSLVFHPRLVGGSGDSVFYRKYLMPVLQNHALEGLCLRREEPWQKEILQRIEDAWQFCAREEPGYEFRVRNALSELTLGLAVHLPEQEKHSGGKVLRDGQRIKTMLRFIHDHYASELDTASIAASAAISESECLRCFHSAIGTTPIRYLRQYRIRMAEQLLSATQLRIADVSAGCGFPDVSYFTKTFREMKGCTPSDFRRQHREK